MQGDRIALAWVMRSGTGERVDGGGGNEKDEMTFGSFSTFRLQISNNAGHSLNRNGIMVVSL